jgi:holo-[acyl-carrier protein] synthase
MILGIGVDLVEVARIDGSIARHGDHFLRRVFTEKEIAYCAPMRAPGPHYAARFAAKEAVAKAFGTGIGEKLSFLDIEVCRSESGAPSIFLHGSAADYAKECGVRKIHVSLSHTDACAVAQVVIEGGDA